MIELIKRKFNSLYWHQFALTAGMVLLTLLLLGVSFFTLSYGTTTAEKRGEMRTRAELIAQVSADYFVAAGDESIDQDTALRKLAEMASRMTDVDFLICSAQGNVLLTTDETLVGRSVTIPPEIVSDVLSEKALYQGRSTVSNIYNVKKFVVAVPMSSSGGELLGMVLAVMDESEIMQVWRSFIGLFLIPELDRSDEIGELAQSFNAMADSLAETERQRRDFIANVSHELKTPMTTIAGYTDGILDGTIPPERERHYLQIISDESRRLSRLVRRMLDISQIQSKEMKKEDFDICEVMRIALLSMEQKINDRGLDVETNIPEDSIMVQGDRDLITQVIYNLLENATKFASPHSALFLGLATNDEKAIISVRNHGATIAPEEIPLLFERFHKSDKSRSEDKDGYGLGLYVVKTILAQHKEHISVTSENGLTSFDFTLQLSAPHNAER